MSDASILSDKPYAKVTHSDFIDAFSYLRLYRNWNVKDALWKLNTQALQISRMRKARRLRNPKTQNSVNPKIPSNSNQDVSQNATTGRVAMGPWEEGMSINPATKTEPSRPESAKLEAFYEALARMKNQISTVQLAEQHAMGVKKLKEKFKFKAGTRGRLHNLDNRRTSRLSMGQINQPRKHY